MNVVVFEDANVDDLYPVTTGRPAYAISCGSFRLIDWLVQLDRPLQAMVRPHLRSLQSLDFPALSARPIDAHRWTLLVNARLVPSRAVFCALRSLIADENPRALVRDEVLIAGVVPTTSLTSIYPDGLSTSQGLSARFPNVPVEPAPSSLPLFRYAHEIIDWNMRCLEDNLRFRIDSGRYREVVKDVFVGDGAMLGDFIVTDTKRGPIVLDQEAQIGPYCFLRGPAYLGPNARVIEHAAIKDAVSLGHTTKIGGEVEASVIEPFTNKQHHGFLGHSYLGSWINLGAGTCNSDLKNTYGEVKLDLRGQKLSTGMQFVGCIMGDYAKTAINTGIFTGKFIGTCSMIYGFVTTNVPSFVNYARSFGQVTELPPAVMEATQKRMFARRDVEQRPCDIQLLHDMFQLTRNERQLAEEPLVL
jgi:glucose-1-phosphate thymidylyltransferase